MERFYSRSGRTAVGHGVSRRRTATHALETRSQSSPLVRLNLVGNQEYVARPWTRSKVEPDPERAYERPSPERPKTRAPLGNDAAPALANENESRPGGRQPHDAMTDRRKHGERLDPCRQAGERSGSNEQRMQKAPPPPKEARRSKA